MEIEVKRAGKILLVEGNPIIGQGLVMGLEKENFHVDWGRSFRGGLDLYKNDLYDLILLNTSLPNQESMDLYQHIRKKNSKIGILFLPAKTGEDFSLQKLLDDIKVEFIAKQSHRIDLCLGGLTVRPERREVEFKGESILLNRRLFDILWLLFNRANQIVTRDQILSYLERGEVIFERTIDSHLSKLRRMFKKYHVESLKIVSIYGSGYRLEIRSDLFPVHQIPDPGI